MESKTRVLAMVAVCLAAPLMDALLILAAIFPAALPDPLLFFELLIPPTAVFNWLAFRVVRYAMRAAK
jgi:hypothetical protein